ncbi:motility associated factor glycosyltransferase family protein [Mangrovibacterium lignilyticum]|uniref:hypothetical protein n=1 Tax=Mangrovibacterium lignilyticum TaxID=2668052 RepID=UPI0013D6E291|nr:hypothetical protein [Mangrovibacterium lignilyticum]
MLSILLSIQNLLQNLTSTIASLVKVLVFSKKPQRLLKPQNDQVVVLANGPSLNKMIDEKKEFLKGKDLVCVNHFPSTDYYTELKPRYLVSSAPDLWREDIEPFYMEQSERLFKNIAERTSWELIFYFPFEARKFQKWQRILAENLLIKVVFYNTTPIEGWRCFRHFIFRNNLGMPRPHNVIVPSTFLMINSGYREIYLWGADHSWLKDISVDESNNALINQKHFYDEQTSKAKPLDWKGVGARKLHEILYKFMTAFASYFVIDEYAKSRNVHIINNTKGSFIDAFERET